MTSENLGTIKLAGKHYSYHVDSVRQTKMYCETASIPHDDYYKSIFEIGDGKELTNNDLTITFLWSALYAGAIRVNRKCDFTYEDVVDMYEDATGDELKEIAKVLGILTEIIKKKTIGLVTLMKNVLADEKVLKQVMQTAKPEELEAIERLKALV